MFGFCPVLRGPGSSPGQRSDREKPGLFSGLVVIAGVKLPIPSRTRPISAPTPMVLRLKTWESRSPPDLKRDTSLINDDNTGPTKPSDKPWRGLEQPRSPAEGTAFEDEQTQRYRAAAGHLQKSVAGWSSPVARQAHNLKAAGSNPAPATKKSNLAKCLGSDKDTCV
jgi:hypothetical protein